MNECACFSVWSILRCTCVDVYSCGIGISVKQINQQLDFLLTIRKISGQCKFSRLHNLSKITGSVANHYGTLNCPQALPRLQIRTRGSSWNRSLITLIQHTWLRRDLTWVVRERGNIRDTCWSDLHFNIVGGVIIQLYNLHFLWPIEWYVETKDCHLMY